MERPPILSRNDVRDPVALRVFGEIERELGFGMVPNVFLRMSNAPGFLEANWNAFRTIVLSGKLPRTLKEMVGIVVSTVHKSPYAQQVHMHSLGMQGIEKGVLQALAAGSVEASGLSPSSSAVLSFAQKAAASPLQITDADFATLRRNGMGDPEIYELMSTVQLFTAINQFTDVWAVPIDGA